MHKQNIVSATSIGTFECLVLASHFHYVECECLKIIVPSLKDLAFRGITYPIPLRSIHVHSEHTIFLVYMKDN
jgi:hypothetical protein